MFFYDNVLATKQNAPTVCDLRNVSRLVDYVYHIRDRYLVVGPWNGGQLLMFTDASFGIHGDAKSHTGIVIFGNEDYGALYASSNKQKLVAASSTDAELIAIDKGTGVTDYFKSVLNGLEIESKVRCFTDSHSGLKLIQNGLKDRSKRRKLPNVRISVLKEFFDNPINRSTVEWIEGENMSADLLTKDLDRASTIKHSNTIMGNGMMNSSDGFNEIE